jgi:hypothetical protein
VNENGQVGNLGWGQFKDHAYFAFCGRKQSKGSFVIQGVALYVSDAWLDQENLLKFIAEFGTGDEGVESAGSLPSVCLSDKNRAFWDTLQERANSLLNDIKESNRSVQRRAVSTCDCCPDTVRKGKSCHSAEPNAPVLERWKESNKPAWDNASDGIPWWDGEKPIMPDFF